MTTEKRKSYKNLNVKISPEVKEKVKRYKDRTGIAIEVFLPQAIEQFIDNKLK